MIFFGRKNTPVRKPFLTDVIRAFLMQAARLHHLLTPFAPALSSAPDNHSYITIPLGK